ncbi:hypothetical protein RB595_004752 [Gaeumannomyces hyphopodioides]
MLASRITVWAWLPLVLLSSIVKSTSPGPQPANLTSSPLGVTPNQQLFGRQLPQGKCSKDVPCPIHACCNGEDCGFDPAIHCGDKCISKCDAHAECGQFADPPGKECPIHVCCSKHGFCGVEDDFCNDGCQSNCGQPGKTSPHTTDVRELVIGYVESWAFMRRGCAQRKLSALRVDSLTHLFVSFAYIAPSTFEVYPMVHESVFFNITNLKQIAPGLKIWAALGGWSYSDNDTDTQPVWGDLASTQEKRAKFIGQLEKFMLHFGFDGVDYDWEYPGAPDRGGKERDGQNFVELVKDTRSHFKSLNRGWGVSFTAPSSLWYMRHFQIGPMMEHVDFVNLMTYDLFGSWDNQSNWIGPHVYGHTNLTVIKSALNLLWRNSVPANQVNLGIGFYGRTYVLESASCDKPGCKFIRPGRAGQCSGQGGYMSYQDIAWVRQSSGATVVTDRENAIKYFRYDDDQWVSYDDEETLKWKVEFANSQGLRGLFIWAVTQDTAKNDLLNALLQPDGLGKFKKRNGVRSAVDDWDTKTFDNCEFSECGGKCGIGLTKIGDVRCDISGSEKPRKELCCPFSAAPDPKFCKWRSNKSFFACGSQSNKCASGEEKIISDHWFKDDEGRDDVCSFGTQADFCCQAEAEAVCKWSDRCFGPDDSVSCEAPLEWVGRFGIRVCNTGRPEDNAKWAVWCCDKNVKPDCRWLGEPKTYCEAKCGEDEADLGRHWYGGGEDCEDPRYPRNNFYQFGYPGVLGRLLCCKKDSVRYKIKTLPVPLEYLFDEKVEANEEQSFDIDVDYDDGNESRHPNENSFGWHIMSGPPDQFQTLNRRDGGSHWEVFGCDPTRHEGRQSARLVCTRDGDRGDDHNCGGLLRRGGVADMVVEMPSHCGASKYAMAVSLEHMHGASEDTVMHPRLVKRLPRNAQVYNLTFDYGFHRLRGRQSNKMKLRIDYSNVPNYWNEVVAAKPTRKRRRRSPTPGAPEESYYEPTDMEEAARIVKRNHGGDWRQYVDHLYRVERRSAASSGEEEELHELHQRWYTANLVDFIGRLTTINHKVDVLEQRVSKRFKYVLLEERRSCPVGDLEAELYAILDAQIQTSGVLTLIGDLNDMSTFRHSYLNFRNKGEIKASLVFNAHGELRIPHLEETLLGIAPIGASFKIPGVVTIGPEFKLIASLEGRVQIDANARVDFSVAKWDYSQRFPAPDNNYRVTEKEKSPEKPSFGVSDEDGGNVKFNWEVRADGVVELHLTPMVTFGVVFDPQHNLPSAAVDLAVDTYLRVHGQASISSGQSFRYCIGAEVGYDGFARITAPKLFGFSINNRWSLFGDEITVYKSPSCDNARARRRGDAPQLGQGLPSAVASIMPPPAPRLAAWAEDDQTVPGTSPARDFSFETLVF